MLAKCLIINVLRLIIVILFFIAFLNITYTARHTWATLAKYCHVPEEMISEGLGHSSLEVTRTYLKSFDGDELAKVNQVIINYIYSGKKKLWSRA
ncbi:integrase [Bacteroides cellulosilyticus]|uniref:integrase n=1 Tax=Bacteroides cellulosilyticus TaxID=246787 RepID=UPI0030BA1DDC